MTPPSDRGDVKRCLRFSGSVLSAIVNGGYTEPEVLAEFSRHRPDCATCQSITVGSDSRAKSSASNGAHSL